MNSFNFLKKVGKTFSGTCRYYVGKRYKCDRKKDEKCPTGFNFLASLLGAFSIKNTIENSSKNRQRKNIENNCKRLAKWSRNRCQNASKINARTGIETDQGNHQNHVSLKSEIIEIHCKNNGFDDLEGWVCER